MKKYVGTKQIEARPMTRGDYNNYRGWQIPAEENPADEGYLVDIQMDMRAGRRRSSLMKHTDHVTT